MARGLGKGINALFNNVEKVEVEKDEIIKEFE